MSNLSMEDRRNLSMESPPWRSISSSTHCLDYTMRYCPLEYTVRIQRRSCLLVMFQIAGQRPLFKVPCCNPLADRNHYLRYYRQQFFSWLSSRNTSLSPCCVQTMAESFTRIHEYALDNHDCQRDVVPSNAQTLLICLQIRSLTTESSESRVVTESFEAAVPRMKPVSHKALQILLRNKEDRLECEWNDTNRDCIICMDEIQTRKSALNMPCSHVFHEDCLVRWLKTSHFCPLCRYELPTEE